MRTDPGNEVKWVGSSALKQPFGHCRYAKSGPFTGRARAFELPKRQNSVVLVQEELARAVLVLYIVLLSQDPAANTYERHIHCDALHLFRLPIIGNSGEGQVIDETLDDLSSPGPHLGLGCQPIYIL